MASKLVFLAIMCLALGATSPAAEAAISYGQCCNGIKNLNGMAQNTPDQQSVCNCIKIAVNESGFTYSSFNLDLAASLPKKCGVNVPYQISP
ncbi:hypothetical protein TanjilG_19845 [Lupinus angustifolius]|uniref:Non-specific lipid-transfer protein n=1 Tax=Lupinus angustifolius TaxID=3871 RepID=A0A1J7GK96_LUPAN|nr:hypothetical protein TanjilG_19845 [Lupinus angustifolius]